MVKWIVNKWYRHEPECVCGYNMKPVKTLNRYESIDGKWECIFTKSCGWGAWQTTNGTLHWYKL